MVVTLSLADEVELTEAETGAEVIGATTLFVLRLLGMTVTNGMLLLEVEGAFWPFFFLLEVVGWLLDLSPAAEEEVRVVVVELLLLLLLVRADIPLSRAVSKAMKWRRLFMVDVVDMEHVSLLAKYMDDCQTGPEILACHWSD